VPDTETIRNHAAFIWSVADLLRGDYKQSEYGKVILPLAYVSAFSSCPKTSSRA
jgi:type I restriction-modification system DNA methylase subunit